MNNHLNFSKFYDYCNSLFTCWWISPPPPLDADFTSEPKQTLIGLVNPLHPPCISVIEYSNPLRLPPLTGTSIAIITHAPTLSIPLDTDCEIPLMATSVSNNDAIESLLGYLQKNIRPSLHLHGVMMDIFGKGVFITGPSGIGKSECAMHLLTKKHRLICDDIVHFYKAKYNQVIAYSVPSLFNLLEIRGLGIIDVQQWHGACSTLNEKALDLVISLNRDPNSLHIRPLKKQLDEKIILGVSIPHVSLNLVFKQDLAMLIESAVQFAFSLPSAQIDSLLNFPHRVSTEPHP